MSRYRKVDPRIWNDEKFRALSDPAKLVFFLLLTHPNMTALGAMRSTPSGLAEELGWPPEAFREAFGQLLLKGMAEHDAKACLIALPRFLKYNPPESPNVVKAWVGSVDLLPECELKTRVIAAAVAFAEGMTEAFAKAIPKALAKTMPNQKQEQEQKQEQDEKRGARPAQPEDTRRYAMTAEWLPPEEYTFQFRAAGGNPTEAELNRFRSYWIGKGPNTTPDWVQKLISDLKRYRSEPGHQKTQGSQSGGPDHDRPAVESM